jgi:hypothetical protein
MKIDEGVVVRQACMPVCECRLGRRGEVWVAEEDATVRGGEWRNTISERPRRRTTVAVTSSAHARPRNPKAWRGSSHQATDSNPKPELSGWKSLAGERREARKGSEGEGVKWEWEGLGKREPW